MIRYLEKNEFEATKTLYKEVFDDSDEFVDYYYKERINLNRILVEEKDDKIISMLQIVPRSFIINEKEIRADYIYAVATSEKYRGQGLMTRLFKKAIRDLYDEGQAFAYLVEGGYNNYFRLGFGKMNEIVEGYFEAEKSDETLFLKPARVMEEGELANYGRACLNKNKRVYLKRDNDYYYNAIKMLETEGGAAEKLVDTAGNIMAFCFLSLSEEGVTVSEITSKYGYERQMLNIICQKYNVDRVKIIADEKSKIYNMPWIKKDLFGKRTYALARVLNLEKLGNLIPYNEKLNKVIKLEDPVIEENNGVFEITESKDGYSLFLRSDKEPEQEMNIGEFSAMVFGNGKETEIRVEGSDLIWLHEDV